jgi:hypothetical protein
LRKALPFIALGPIRAALRSAGKHAPVLFFVWHTPKTLCPSSTSVIKYQPLTNNVGGRDNASLALRNRILRDPSPHDIQEASIKKPAHAGIFLSHTKVNTYFCVDQYEKPRVTPA